MFDVPVERSVLIFKVPRRGQQIYHLLAAEQDMTTVSKDEDVVRHESTVPVVVDVLTTSTEFTHQPPASTATTKVSPEVYLFKEFINSRP